MARTRRSASASNPSVRTNDSGIDASGGDFRPPVEPPVHDPGAETTGRYVIVYRKEVLDSPKVAIQSLNKLAGIKDVVTATDFAESSVDLAKTVNSDALYLPAIGVAVVSADDDQLQNLMEASSETDSRIMAVEPEYVYHAIHERPFTQLDYLKGYRDAVNHLYDRLTAMTDSAETIEEAAAGFLDNSQFTWGLQATRVNSGRSTGKGIKVAILDTGIDLKHPDFKGRKIVSQSFIPKQTVQDVQGHGTHCAGTACGPLRPSTGVRRYGCAYEAELYVGKVLSDSGSSVGSSVLSGMNWAVANGCQVISMSLGADVNQPSQAFEQIGRRALSAGCLIIAAAGNNAERSLGNPGFVGQPANSLSIMAVAAIDSRLKIADFSARSSSASGTAGKIDIAAPGVGVFSSIPGGKYDSWDGTSMATPHVAGIAALWCQLSGRTGAALWTILTQNCRRISGDVADLGAGLIQAPQQ
jgi:subtilisin family serine protease